jgi:quinol-cytochrome oxidoreductase complex cytochrome b subunit
VSDRHSSARATLAEREALEPDVYPVTQGRLARARGSELWRSVFRHPSLDTPRGRALQSFSNVFLHIYPVKVPARVLRFRYSWRLGYIATVLFGILVTTGVYLMFFYTPSVSSAYGDMQQLRTGVGFGQLVRNVHRWSAHLMVLVVIIHMARVFYAGAYKRPRQFNWVLGLALLAITLGFSFTGYLLPWDQLSYWAVTVGTNLVSYVPLLGGILRDVLIGGEQIGQVTLLRFYALHVAVLPVALAMVLMVHIWRVRKDGFAVRRGGTGAFAEAASIVAIDGAIDPAADAAGGDGAPGEHDGDEPVVLPPLPLAAGAAAATAATAMSDDRRVRLLGVVDRESVTASERLTDDTVFTWPHLLVRHVVVGLGVCATALALGIAFAAPLRGIANPAETPEPAKAPWYFVGLQELLSRFDPLVAGILLPAGAFVALMALPYLDRNPATEARNRRVAIVIFTIVLAAAIVLTVIGVFFRGPGWKFIPPWHHSYVEL